MSLNRQRVIASFANGEADVRVDTPPPSTSKKTVLEDARSLQGSVDEVRKKLCAKRSSNAKLLATLKRSKEQQLQGAVQADDAADSLEDVSDETKELIEDITIQSAKKIKLKSEGIALMGKFSQRYQELSKEADEKHGRNQVIQKMLETPARVSIVSNQPKI